MRRHLQRLAGPMPVALGLLVLAVVAVLVATAGPVAVWAEGVPTPTALSSSHDPAANRQTPASPATSPNPASAAQLGTPAATPPTVVTDISTSDTACIACHQATLVVTLASRETITATVDVNEFNGSIHGRKLTCVACHADKATGYPHSPLAVADRRSYTAAAAAACVRCHKGVREDFAQSVHGQALESGNVNAATCTDCHGAHNVSNAARLERKPQLCGTCHGVVTETYNQSVHGQLLASGRADAASCLSCHTTADKRSGHSLVAVDDPNGPTSAKFVPETCGTCHKQALKSYNTTFHGRAMRLGVAQQAPNCVDCHGAYGVQRVHAAETPVSETHFATVCAKCHPGANESFASGWMGHEEPSPAWFPAVFFTERFLFFLTTSAVAFGILHVELDLLRWLVDRRKRGGRKEDK